MCVLIYFDEVPNQPSYNFGEMYSVFLRNLLGHFPEVQQIVSPIERYQAGEINNCRSSIYIGSYFDNAVPQAFLEDFKTTQTNVAWLGYNIWMFPEEDLTNMFGHQYKSLTTIDYKNLSPDGLPSFHRYFEYKGETFEKFAKWVGEGEERRFAAAFEVVELVKPEESLATTAEVLSWSKHSLTGEEAPYIIRNENKFFVADVPFSYAHESDRYLIFSDLLFDILDLPPKRDKKIAFVRIEDVHPLSNLADLYHLLNVFESEQIPLHVALVPIFYDPLYKFDRAADEEFVTIKEHSGFKLWLESAKALDANFIWHGVTHQYQTMRNPHTGYSSDDFEFWDAVNNVPVPDDSVDFVLNRLELGSSLLADLEIYPQAWLTPHYQASSLDYRIFARVFPWNVGRAIYFLDTDTGLGEISSDEQQEKLHLHNRHPEGQAYREDFFKDLQVQVESEWFGQLYPYEIYSDIYGQKLIPEILGNPQPFESDHVWYPRKIDDIIADAKRNRVIRDSWASLFFHPYLLTNLENAGIGEYPGDTRPFVRLIKEIKDLGYEFKPLNDFIEETKDIKTKKTIFLKP